MRMLISKHLFNIHTCTCMVLKFVCLNACHTLRKNAHAPVHARLCHGAEISLPWKTLRIVLSLMQTSCRLLFAKCCLYEIGWPTLLAQEIRPTLAHDAVHTAVSHKHHSIFCIGAGLIQFVDGLNSRLGHGAHPSNFCIFAILRAFWQCVACVCVYTHIHTDNCCYYFQQ